MTGVLLFSIYLAMAAAEAAATAIIDTRILGEDVKTFGKDLEAQPWQSGKFGWMNYEGAVSADLRDNMKRVEAARTATARSHPGDAAAGDAACLHADAGLRGHAVGDDDER